MATRIGRYIRMRKPIYDHLIRGRPERVMEIGLAEGRNLLFMACLCDAQFYVFDDLSQDNSRDVYKLLRRSNRISFFIGDSKKILPEAIGDLPDMDVIFIDGRHDYETVKSDWENCKKLMHDKTSVFFHDILTEGPKQVIEELGAGFKFEKVEKILGKVKLEKAEVD